jgi:outer membrane receptor protein involved in Fe transport
LTFGTVADHIAGTETLLGTKPLFIDAQGSRDTIGFYAQYEHKFTEYLKVIGGFQLNKIGEIATSVVPRFGVLWTPASHFTLKALFGGAFRAPSLDETLLNHPALKGNPNLLAETVGTFDVQASYQDNHFQASIDFFRSVEKHLIVEDASGFPARYINLKTPATFDGIDSESKYYFRKDWFLIASALYETNHNSVLSPLSAVPDFSAKAGISYQASNGATMSVFDAYQAHTPGYSEALNPHPDAIHSVSAHLRYDLSKRWLKSEKRGLAPFVYADNLTNTPIWLPAWGSGVPNTIPVNHGRTIFFGIEFWQKAE